MNVEVIFLFNYLESLPSESKKKHTIASFYKTSRPYLGFYPVSVKNLFAVMNFFCILSQKKNNHE